MALIATVYAPETVAVVSDTLAPIGARFPVPPIAWGFGDEPDLAWSLNLLTGYIMGAVSTEGVYMEPTLGQIWPRIG